VLEEIRLSGLGVIAEATVALDPGLTVLTGETGAGKTMLLSALGLLFGGRADAGLVRAGHARALVEGRLRLPADHEAYRRAIDAGAEPDEDGSIVVHRTVSAEGRSRATLGGASVPVSVLGEVAAQAVAVHGQADQQRLTSAVRQREVLDRFAGAPAAEALAWYAAAYATCQRLEVERNQLVAQAATASEEADRLRFALDRIEALDPRPDEDDELAATVARLGHADTLREAATQAYLALAGDDNALPGGYAALAAAQQALHLSADHDPDLAALRIRSEEVVVLAGELQADLAAYVDQLAADPDALARAQSRQAALHAVFRAYVPADPRAAALLDWGRDAAARWALLDNADVRRAALDQELSAAQADRADAEAALRKIRLEAASRLARETGVELAGLAMPGAELAVRVEPAEPGPTGADSVAFMLASHQGAPLRPLGRGASGGELSRVMLALEVVLAGADPMPTMVFDEVDAGVGGEAAVEVGIRLARLARHHQILVVTHLPQVAAYADRHVHVRRGDSGGVGESDAQVLDHDGRIAELARMLGGLGATDAAREHAGELLARADLERSESRLGAASERDTT
jgi:DNA repair protein RecN (Recombination protein N)